MKKFLAIFMTCILFFTSSICVSANQDFNPEASFEIQFNGVNTGYVSIVRNNTHYIPLRTIFETMGAFVFYRSRDWQVLALTRDGEMIRHIVGEKSINVNGEQRFFDNPSISENYTTYIPIEMLSSALCVDGVSYENNKLNIKKYLFNNDYHKVIKDVLDMIDNSNFYPERFKRYINYHLKMPSFSMQDVILKVNMGLDYPFYENVTTVERPYELLVLVNKYNQLPQNFTQYNLVNMKREYTINDGKQYLLAGVAYEEFVQMAEAAKKEGLSIKTLSAYRTEAYQSGLYNNKIRTNGKVYADSYSARPGFSEHQLGLAVDISSTNVSFENSAEFKWLQQHAHEYGYILRYPKGKEWITGYAYEPWHYRYVGAEVAKMIHDEGITFEEFHAKYKSFNEFK